MKRLRWVLLAVIAVLVAFTLLWFRSSAVRWRGQIVARKLAGRVDERTTKSKRWPATPRGMSGSLRRAATLLRKADVNVEFVKEGHKRTRKIFISNAVGLTENKGL